MDLSLDSDISSLPGPEELRALQHQMNLRARAYEDEMGFSPTRGMDLEQEPSESAQAYRARPRPGDYVPHMLEQDPPQGASDEQVQQPPEQYSHFVHLLTRQPEQGLGLPSGHLPQQQRCLSPTLTSSHLQPSRQTEFPPEAYPAAVCNQEEVLENRSTFTDALIALHKYLGVTEKIPRIGGRELDLHMLYQNVCKLGGCEAVINGKLWRDAAETFRYPETITNVSFSLRKAYFSFLWDFEQVYMHGQGGQSLVPHPTSQKEWGGPSLEPVASFIPAASLGARSSKRRHVSTIADSFAGPLEGTPTHLVAAARGPGSSEALNVGSRGSVVLDSRFDAGFFVSVKVGKQDFQGILYYPPPERIRKEAVQLEKQKDRVSPKPRRTPFNFFSMSNRLKTKQAFPELSQIEITRKVGSMWQNCSEAEKAPFVAIAQQDKSRYQAELEAHNYKLASQAASEAAGMAASAVAAAQEAMTRQQSPACDES